MKNVKDSSDANWTRFVVVFVFVFHLVAHRLDTEKDPWYTACPKEGCNKKVGRCLEAECGTTNVLGACQLSVYELGLYVVVLKHGSTNITTYVRSDAKVGIVFFFRASFSEPC